MDQFHINHFVKRSEFHTIHKYTYCTALQIDYKSWYYRTKINIVTDTHSIYITPGLFAIIVDIRKLFFFYFLLVTMMSAKLLCTGQQLLH